MTKDNSQYAIYKIWFKAAAWYNLIWGMTIVLFLQRMASEHGGWKLLLSGEKYDPSIE